MLFYWELEGSQEMAEPEIRNTKETYEVTPLAKSDLTALKNLSFINYDKLLESFDRGAKVIGLKNKDEIAAFTCVEYSDFIFRKKRFELHDNEAYLLNMYTFQSHRGKNLAPFLRYQVYQMLKKEGVGRIYSVTDYLNKSSIKFKRKLGAKPLVLYFSVIFFKRLHWTFALKRY